MSDRKYEAFFQMKDPAYRSSILTNGLGRSGQRALLYATGMDQEDLKKPFVAVIGSFSEMVPGHAHLRELAEYVCQGVIEGEGCPAEARPSPSATAFARDMRECGIPWPAGS